MGVVLSLVCTQILGATGVVGNRDCPKGNSDSATRGRSVARTACARAADPCRASFGVRGCATTAGESITGSRFRAPLLPVHFYAAGPLRRSGLVSGALGTWLGLGAGTLPARHALGPPHSELGPTSPPACTTRTRTSPVKRRQIAPSAPKPKRPGPRAPQGPEARSNRALFRLHGVSSSSTTASAPRCEVPPPRQPFTYREQFSLVRHSRAHSRGNAWGREPQQFGKFSAGRVTPDTIAGAAKVGTSSVTLLSTPREAIPTATTSPGAGDAQTRWVA